MGITPIIHYSITPIQAPCAIYAIFNFSSFAKKCKTLLVILIVGMLENLCLETIKEEPVNDCVKNYISCISTNHSDVEKSKFNSSKAKVQTLLASKVPMVNSLGLAALKGYWDFEHSCFKEIKRFIKKLFE